MSKRPSLQKIAKQAKNSGKLELTAQGLADLWKWLEDEYHISDPKELEYVRERVCLAPGGASFTCDPAQVLAYLAALGQLIVRDSNTRDQSEKQAALQSFLDQVREREASSVLPENTELWHLLDDDLRRNTKARSSKAANKKPRVVGSLVQLPADGTLYVVGDLHGDAHTVSLLDAYFRRQLYRDAAREHPVYIVFMGDYVNNGLRSIETLLLILELRQDYAENVFLLSGNHEFTETYATAFAEHFGSHWQQWRHFSARLSPEFKTPPRHYGHIRTDLVRRYGIETGERLYAKFAEWGQSLPFLVQSDKRILICHSLGFDEDRASSLTIDDFIQAKLDPVNSEELEAFGYKAWKIRRKTLYSQMVNNRAITNATLDCLAGIFDVEVFVVGHTHFRSGDRDYCKDGALRPANPSEGARLLTVCSSHPRSPDAGHYIAHEFEASRQRASRREGRTGVAYPCVARFDDRNVNSVYEKNVHHLVHLAQE